MNGVRRAVTSARRLIGFLFIAAYYGQVVFRSFVTPPNSTSPSDSGKFGVVQFDVVRMEAGTFAVFAIFSAILFITSISPKGGFRQADVDVLFATPINPKIVLYFRIVRDYLVTLVFPIFVTVLLGRPATRGVFTFFRNFPKEGALAAKLFSFTYLLLSLCWVCVGYAISLFINRSDEQSDKNKKIIDGTIIAIVISVIAYVTYRFHQDFGWNTMVDLSRNPILKIVFLSSTAATAILMAPFHRSWAEGAAGFLGLVGVGLLSLKLGVTQVEYLYDQAAAKGFQNADISRLRRSGDTYGIMAAQARQGKLRRSTLATRLSQWTVKGSFALLWKESILLMRGGSGPVLLTGVFTLVMVMAPMWAASRSESVYVESGIMLLFTGLGVLVLSISSSTGGFIELLRRGDLQKPLPFSPAVTVFWEVVGKTIPSLVIAAFAAAGAMLIDLRLWMTAVAATIMAPSLALTVNSVGLIVMLLFPDVDDASQRGFRGFMLLMGAVLGAFPGVAIAAALFAIHVPPILISIPFVIVDVIIALALSSISGGLYGSFNPSE